MEDFFFKLGRRAGQGARKGRWLWTSALGTEAEALRAEHEVGLDLARAFEQQAGLDDEPRCVALVEEISGRLARRLVNRERRWRVAIMCADEPGAFALPGGFVYVTRPLLELCRMDEDEVACVVGHEMGHVVRGHAMERIQAQLVTSAATRLARLPAGLISQWMLTTGTGLLHSAYSRDRELDADEFGARLAAAAGYDPRGAIRALSRLQSMQAEQLPLAEYFASHPPLEERIAQLRGLIRVREAPSPSGGG